MIKEYCDILILSATYGGGHNQVARALTQAFQHQVPKLKIITVDYSDLVLPVVNRLSHFGYTQTIRHFPVGYALYYQATGKISADSFWQRRLNRLGYTELIRLVNRLQPRVIVSTFPLQAGALSQMKEAGDLNVPVVTVITDMCVHNQWIHPYTDLYIVGSDEVANGLIERGVPKNKVAATGIPIMLSFNQTQNKEELMKKYGIEEHDKVVVFMGGSEGMFRTTKFNRILDSLDNNSKALVLTGSNQELYERLSDNYAYQANLKILGYVDNMAGILDLTDVLVTKPGGITISEALAKGIPMVICKPLPGQEESNANFLWRHRAAIIAHQERRVRSAVIRMVNDEEFRQRFSRNCLKIGKPDSAEAAARLILKQITPVTRNRNLIAKKIYRASEVII